MEQLTIQPRLELGLVGGFIGSVISAILLTIFGATRFLPYPIFEQIGQSLPLGQPAVGFGINGLMQHVIIGLFCAIIFALVFRTYTLTLGLSFAGILTIMMTLIFLLVTLPRVGIAISQLTLMTCVQVVISIAVANAAYGLLLSATCQAYLRQ